MISTRTITGIISGSSSELPFDPTKADHPINVWFRYDGAVWFGVAELSGFIPTLHEPDDQLFGFCELVGDCWRWEGEGDPYGFELTDTDFGGYFRLKSQRAAVQNLKEEFVKALTPLVNLRAFILNNLGAKR